MFLRVDKLLTELPQPAKANPNAASDLQELLGGKYGEMFPLNNYMLQSFHSKNKGKLKPFCSLVASITAEEVGHVELVTTGVAMLNGGPDEEDRGGPPSGHARRYLPIWKVLQLKSKLSGAV
jgi:Mn-containing catalase